jgi:hypothetical protein
VILGRVVNCHAFSHCPGGTLEDPAGFVKRLNQLMLAMGEE